MRRFNFDQPAGDGLRGYLWTPLPRPVPSPVVNLRLASPPLDDSARARRAGGWPMAGDLPLDEALRAGDLPNGMTARLHQLVDTLAE